MNLLPLVHKMNAIQIVLVPIDDKRLGNQDGVASLHLIPIDDGGLKGRKIAVSIAQGKLTVSSCGYSSDCHDRNWIENYVYVLLVKNEVRDKISAMLGEMQGRIFLAAVDREIEKRWAEGLTGFRRPSQDVPMSGRVESEPHAPLAGGEVVSMERWRAARPQLRHA